MPAIKMQVPHHLTQEEATSRVKTLIQDLRIQFGSQVRHLQEEWSQNGSSFRFDVMGFTVSGTLSIEPTQVELTGQLPMAALPFRNRIETVIRNKLTSLLE